MSCLAYWMFIGKMRRLGKSYIWFMCPIYLVVVQSKYCIRAMVSKAGRINAADSEVNQEIHVLLDALKADPRSNGRLGMLGQFNRGYVIQMAKREDMLAPVVYHHSLGIQGAGVPKKNLLDDIRILQGHWAKC